MSKVIDIKPIDLIQSPYTYLQAAGSLGGDGSTKGVHLRFFFNGELGSNHLPKGNLSTVSPYQTTAGFNKPNDFIHLYRVPYINPYPAVIDFLSQTPDRLFETGSKRSWEFDVTIAGMTNQNVITTIEIRFEDQSQYDIIRSTVDPNNTSDQFLKNYDGMLEVQAKDKLAFCISVGLKLFPSEPSLSTPTGILRMEAVSEGDTNLVVSCRRKFIQDPDPIPDPTALPVVENTLFMQPDNFGWHKMLSENTLYFRFKYEEGVPMVICVETYEDFIIGTAQHPDICWESMDDFSLSLDLPTVENRLDNNAFQVDKNWARFNDQDNISGKATVNVDNYKEKWRPAVINGDDYIEKGVIDYLTLSTNANNLKAEKIISAATGANQSPPNTAVMNISFLEMLKLISLDFHLARMLGLGTIDPDPQTANQPYIYLQQYFTKAPLEVNGPANTVGHYYMTLPTRQSDERLPLPPTLKPLEYGLTIPALPNPISLTDAAGYAPYEALRYVRLYLEPPPINSNSFLPFFNIPDNFCLNNHTQNVYYGLEYKNSSAANYQHPELSHDTNYSDHAGYYETMPIAQDNDYSKPLFIHDERTPGFHKYQAYGFNIFARASALGNIRETDETIFPKVNNLLPPVNLQVQLIQKEVPLLFTTPAEQLKLANINPSNNQDDEILVRMTFGWNHIHNIAHQKANKVELFFREQDPGIVRGLITAKTNLPDNKVEVTVGAYTNTSNGSTVTPVITPGEESRYIASRFSVDGEYYMVENVFNSGTLRFVLQKRMEPQLIETPLNSGNFITAQTFFAPDIGDTFIVTENLSALSAWPNNLLSRQIDLINFTTNLKEDGSPAGGAQTHEETKSLPDGSTSLQTIGGIFERASVVDILDIEDDGFGNPVPVAGSSSGAYTITFDTFNLADHPDPEVSWYGGTVRIKQAANNEKSILEVLSIDTTGSTLVIKAYDPTWQVVGGGDYTPTGDFEPIELGNNLLVNFHPAYSCYLFAETGFDQAQILPNQGAGMKTSYMSVRSSDTSLNCQSMIATPVLLQAREIVVSLPPNLPQGPLFATRPGNDGKATYTFDTEVNTNGRKPFSLVFYRASDQTILDQLYTSATVDTILAALKTLNDDEALFMVDRWKGLVAVDLELTGADAGKFKTYHTTPGLGTYRFPEPDNTDYRIPNADPNIADVFPFPIPSGTTISEKKAIIQRAIYDAFVPILQQPALYDQIDDGYQTSKRKPKIRNSNGDRLLVNDPEFDPNPMLVVFPPKSNTAATHTIRCTDYTLDGASVDSYFYYAVEMSNNFTFGPPSEITGPIRLVNSLPPEPPEIRKVISLTEDPVANIDPMIRFEINDYLPSDGINKFQIYRTTKAEDARSIQTMTPIGVYPILDKNQLQDDFKEERFPLFGENLFYRIVAIREIENEKIFPNNREDITSYPSELILASLVDVKNPIAPALTYTTLGLTNTSPPTLNSIRLKWKTTTYNGTYYLYEETSSGNWEVIHEVASNDSFIFYDLGDLVKEDAEGNVLFYRYRIGVQNSSGLFNQQHKILTI